MISSVRCPQRRITHFAVRKVRVHYIKEGDDMLVDKVVVTEVRD
jgi:hypothetical protein